MFGLNDNNDNQGGNQNFQGQGARVHGPLSNTSLPSNSTSVPEPSGPPSSPAPIKDIHPPQTNSGQPTTDEDKLLDIKHQALENLTPLISHLDQTPEEKFKTTMMLIQASDNPQLLSDAYEAANQIEDEKVRAQALLDVVNEINYFTHHQHQNEQN